MEPYHPSFSARGQGSGTWRLARLARLDGRVRELMRQFTIEPADAANSVGEIVWARHVLELHDDHGVLYVGVTQWLADNPWMVIVAAATVRAWDGEDERDIVFIAPDGRRMALEELLPPLQPVPQDL